MKLYHRVFASIFTFVLIIYSFVLIDPNFTLFNHPIWTVFRNELVKVGYYQRNTSSLIYIFIIAMLFLFHWFCIKNYKTVSFRFLAILAFFIAIFSYPFLSHDFFNYLFDAKILTFYHQNPYLHRPIDFPSDPWLRFMHWTHRTYPYGPVFLLLTVIPSFLSFGKLIVDVILFKVVFFALFLWSFHLLYKMNQKWGVYYATNPLVIMEGLVNSHNDFVALSLAVIGIFYIKTNDNIRARIFLILSGGIKYITIPFIFLQKQASSKINIALVGVLFVALCYLSFQTEIQPWYFLALFALIPFYEKLIMSLSIFYAGLLFSYYPYVRFGPWNESWQVNMKHEIIIVFVIINAAYMSSLLLRKTKKR